MTALMYTYTIARANDDVVSCSCCSLLFCRACGALWAAYALFFIIAIIMAVSITLLVPYTQSYCQLHKCDDPQSFLGSDSSGFLVLQTS